MLFGKKYREIVSDLNAQAETDDERRLMNQIDQATAPWREADDQVMKLSLAGNRAQASIVYRERALPCFDSVIRAAEQVLQFHQKRVEEINQSRSLLTARMSLAILIVGLGLLACTALFTTLISRSIAKPLHATIAHLGDVARGDVSSDMPAEYLKRGDEIGLLATGMQTMSNSLRGLIGNITEGIGVLSASSAELSANSTQMSHGSHQASDKAHAVAAAAEQMTTNVTSVASGMEQASIQAT